MNKSDYNDFHVYFLNATFAKILIFLLLIERFLKIRSFRSTRSVCVLNKPLALKRTYLHYTHVT
jgi:hypothetical protein